MIATVPAPAWHHGLSQWMVQIVYVLLLVWVQKPCPVYYEIGQDLGFYCCSWLKCEVVAGELGCSLGYFG
jgi:hypothetical protein